MKNLLLIFAVCAAATAAAQSRDVTRDTTYITNIGGRIFETRCIDYDNGESNGCPRRLIGDTTATVAYFATLLQGRAVDLNSAAQVVIRRNAALRAITDLDALVAAAVGQSPLQSIQNTSETPFYTNGAGVTGWTLIDANGTRPVTFDHNSAGLLRYRINGGTRERLIVFGEVIRLKNYPATNTDTELYRLPSGSYTNLDRTVTLKKP
jgi:hypothetical protein